MVHHVRKLLRKTHQHVNVLTVKTRVELYYDNIKLDSCADASSFTMTLFYSLLLVKMDCEKIGLKLNDT